METAQHPRNENLQMLRFVAAALVLVAHITFYVHERIDVGVGVWREGGAGVLLFFVISGYVMHLSGGKLSRNAEGATRFFRRRVARIFPLYWLITTLKLAIALIAPAAVLHNRPDLPIVLASYVLFPMLNDAGEVAPLHGVGWTLLHEMLFYYVFTISLLLRQSPVVCGSLTIVGLWVMGLLIPADTALARVCFSSINLMFVVGMVLASLSKQRLRLPKFVALALLIIGIGLLISSNLGDLRRAFIGEFAIEVVFIVAASLSVNVSVLPKLKRLFIRLGDSSYSLYMIHPIFAPAVCLMLMKLGIQSIYCILPLTFASCVVVAHFVYRYVENPLNLKAGKFLEKLSPSTAPTQVPAEDVP